jgi:hypothetical protein
MKFFKNVEKTKVLKIDEVYENTLINLLKACEEAQNQVQLLIKETKSLKNKTIDHKENNFKIF